MTGFPQEEARAGLPGWLAVFVSLLALAAGWIVEEAGAGSLAGLALAAAGGAAPWAWNAWRWRRRFQWDPDQHRVATRGEPDAQPTHRIVHTLAGNTDLFDISDDELRRVDGLISDAIPVLVSAFGDIAGQVRQQQELFAHVVSGDSTARFSTFVTETSTTLQSYVDKLVQSSKTAMELVEQMERISGQVGEVSRILGEIDAIAKQTNLLALNAAIEAARAGESGRGFAVVADEVRALSNRTASFSSQIRERMQGIENDIGQADACINTMASQDMVTSLSAKANVEQAIGELEQLNQHMATAATDVSRIAATVEERAHLAITNLQFHDLSSQLIQHARAQTVALRNLLECAGRIGRAGNAEEGPAPGLLHELDQLAADARALAARTPVRQQAMATGGVDLF